MERQQEINSRNSYIKTLNEFLVKAKSLLEEKLKEFNWTESATISKESEEPLITCPLDPGHRLKCNSVDKHVEMCRWHRLGYRDDDIPFPPRPAKLPPSSVLIDKTLQRDIILRAAQNDPSMKIGENVLDREVPQTSDRFFSDFTTDERRVLYDHVVSKTAGVMPQLKEFNLTMKPEGGSAPMTREQLLAAERDAKRRRVKHRAAKVHTKSKNYSEVLREVINNQMLAYEDWIKENFGSSNPTESEQPEMQKTVETKQEKQEMIWLDLDFWSNPHIRWKSILEKEKRRKEKEQKDKERGNIREKEREKGHKDKMRDKDKSRSRSHHHKEEFRKGGSDGKHKRENLHCSQSESDHESSFSERKSSKSSQKESYHSRRESHHSRRESHHSRRESHHSRKESHHSRKESHYSGEGSHYSRKESHHSRSREDRLEGKHLQAEKHKRYWDDGNLKPKSDIKNGEEEYKSKYRKKGELDDNPNKTIPERGVEYHKEERSNSSRRKWDRYDGFNEMEMKPSKRIKEEKSEDTHNLSRSSYKSYKDDRMKMEYESESTDSEND